jgi:hypothetical protein
VCGPAPGATSVVRRKEENRDSVCAWTAIGDDARVRKNREIVVVKQVQFWRINYEAPEAIQLHTAFQITSFAWYPSSPERLSNRSSNPWH